jgi:hypothetical protein
MKKYIFAGITFITGLLVAVLIQVFFIQGVLIQTILYGTLIAVTLRVYNRIKDKEPAIDDDSREGQISDAEKKMFDDSLGKLNFEKMGITEILVGKSKSHRSDYTVIIRTGQGLFRHAETITKKLSEQFRERQNFQISLNTPELELESLMKAIYRVQGINQVSSTAQSNPEF